MNKLQFIATMTLGAVCASVVPLFLKTGLAETRVLPFQGRLTDVNGVAIPDGTKVIQFKLYDAPTGGTALWNGEIQKLSINGGLINTFLGTKSSLDGVNLSKTAYLEITIDANNDEQISLADPPLLPRQSIVPALYAFQAQDASKLNGSDWSAIFVTDTGSATNNPQSGFLNGGRIRAGSVTNTQIAVDAVNSSTIANGTVKAEDLDPNLKLGGGVPTGCVMACAGGTVPSDWELCDGRSVLRTDPKYTALFAAIGTAHGAADDTHFNLPDYRGRFLRGTNRGSTNDPDALSRSAANPGGVAGDATGSVQGDALKAHAHSYKDAKIGGPNISNGTPVGGVEPQPDIDRTTDLTGGTETRPKNAAVDYIIKL